MTLFTFLLRASLIFVIVASIVCCSGVATQYVNVATTDYVDGATTDYVNGATIFGRCANFSVQAGTSVSFDGVQTDVVSGNVGVAPGTSITGTPLLATGYTKEACTSSAQNCAADEATAYGYLKGLTCTNTLANADLSGVTLLPGVYCTGSGVFILTATALYLDAQGDVNAQFIFQTTTTVTTAASTNIILINGALVKNIYWQVGSSITLGASSSFMGQILAYASITVGSTANVVGRLYAREGVTCSSGATITLPARWWCWLTEPINTKQTEQPPPPSKVK